MSSHIIGSEDYSFRSTSSIPEAPAKAPDSDLRPRPGTSASPLLSRSEDSGHSSNEKSNGTNIRVQEQHFRPSRRPQFLLNWWQEILACFVMIATLIALFVTLYVYSGRPSPEWPTWISLNAIIAVYIVLLKAAVLLVTAEGLGQLKWSWFAKTRPLIDIVRFDNATRGPWGSLRLLWELKARYILASFGAVITILALAADPIAQQIIRYYDCAIEIPNTQATIPRTNLYRQIGGFHTGAGMVSILPSAQNAINAGVFGNGVASPTAECSSGNCTWTKEYSTLGWCSSCQDISDMLSFSNNTWRPKKSELNGFAMQNGTTWNLTTSLPNVTDLNNYGPEVHDPVHVDMTSKKIMVEYAAMGSSPGPIALSPLASIDFVLGKNIAGTVNPSTNLSWPGCDSPSAEQTFKCQGYGASRCKLGPCVKTYSAIERAGKFTETLVHTANGWGLIEGNSLGILDTYCVNPSERSSLKALGYEFDPAQRWLPYNLSYPFTKWQTNDSFPNSLVQRDCVYVVEMTFAMALSQFLIDLFTGSVVGPTTLFSELPLGAFTGPEPIRALFNFGDVTFDRIDQAFENITESLTTYMRFNGMQNFSAPAVGITNQEKTCIGVRWPWLAFPGTLVLLTLVFFVCTMVNTMPTGVKADIWKSSPLALLYHGLVTEDGKTFGPGSASGRVERTREMKDLARKTTASLRVMPGNAAFLEVKSL